jgi:putative endopeptidase
MKKANWGFDARDMDMKVRPQDDFYRYANGGWLKKNPIPAHESRWGSFLVLRYDTEKKLRALVTKLKNMKKLQAGSPEQMVRDFYRSGLDMRKRNAAGLTPLRPWLERIEKTRDISSLVSALAHLEKIGGGGPWGAAIDQDMKDSERYLIYLHQSGLGMPDRDYYLKDDAESVRVRTAYEKHLEAMFALMGKTKEESKKSRETVMRIETALAKVSMPKEDLRDVDKVYHKKSLAQLQSLARNVDWKNYFKILGANPKCVIVMQPEFIKAASALLAKVSLEEWKTYLTWHLVGGSAGYLGAKFEKQSFAFYGTALSGVKVMKPLWRRSLGAVNGNVGELLGRLYVKEYFSPEAKRKIQTVVADLFEAYEMRIRNLDWMGGATKRKAVQKLRQMTRKLGYPDKWKSYRSLVIKPDDYLGNAIRATLFEHARTMRRLKKHVDRKEWFMNPQTVNAYCSFGLNDIVFPAAILQPPFFNANADDDALNYGAIGTVIGHEITHGFDDQGSKFDGKGNRKTWWMKTDSARFAKKAKVLVKQFDGYKVADGLKVNGRLTLGENIADLGGASIAYDAYQLRLAKSGRKNIGGFTPEQRFFLGFALFERENSRPEAQKTLVLTDPHSPGVFRINGPASNLGEFYAAFGVRKGDALYRKPEERAKVW